MYYDRIAKFILVGGIVIILSALAWITLELLRSQATVSFGRSTIHVRLADTQGEQAVGLSGTKPLERGQGMLFIFGQSTKWAIWMKDMNYSIDIVWLDQGHSVIAIEPSISPRTYPHVFVPPVPARYVLELPAGYVVDHGLRVGSEASFSPWAF